MNDPKLANAPIVRKTLCNVGTHVFLWTSTDSSKMEPVDTSLRCECQTYTWAEWQKVMEGKS